MYTRFASLALAAALVPTAALAQSAPPPMPPPDTMGTPSAAQRSTMEQMHAQMMRMHQQARAQMLAALTTQHRTFVQNVIGALATAPSPNPQAAAQQIDATLSPSEKQSVLNIESNLRTNAHNMMAAQRAQFEANMSPAERQQMQARHDSEHGGWQGSGRTPDAGAILLRTLGEHGMWGMGRGMHP